MLAVAVDLRSEAEVDGEVQARLLALRLECGESRQEAGADPGDLFLWYEAASDRASFVD